MRVGFPAAVGFSQKQYVVVDCLLLAVGLFILSACHINWIPIPPSPDKPITSSLSTETLSGFCPDSLTIASDFSAAQADETLVVVSNFADPQGNDPHNLTLDLVGRIRKTLSPYTNIRVEQLDCAIKPQDGNETALRIGKRPELNANIMIWGAYVTPPDSAVRIYFTIVKEKESYLGAGFSRSLGPQALQPSRFDFEANLGAQMNEVSDFTSGVILFNDNEHLAAEPLFTAALTAADPQQTDAHALLIHLYRGANDLYIGRVFDAKSELELLQPAKTVTGEALNAFNLPLLNALGLAYSGSGGQRKALVCYDQMLPLYLAVSDKAGEAKSLNVIAAIHAALGDYQKVYEVYNQALLLNQSIGNKVGEVRVLTNLGIAHQSVHEYQQAYEYYEQALHLVQSAGDKAGEASVRNTIGSLLYETDEEQKALEYFNQALVLYQSISDKAGEAEVRTNTALVYYSLGDKQKTLESFQQVLALYQTIGDKVGEASALIYIGDFYTAQDQEQKAQEYYNQAVALYQSLGDKAGEARFLARLGDSQLSLLEQQKALDYYNQALLMYQAVSNTAGEARILNKIGSVYRYAFFEEQKALEYYQRALPLYQAEGNKEGEATTLYNIADFYDFTHDTDQALKALRRAQEIFHSTADRWSEVIVRNRIATLLADDDLDGAAETLETAIVLATEIDHPMLSMLQGLLEEINAKRNE